jgi:hypothetical protein
MPQFYAGYQLIDLKQRWQLYTQPATNITSIINPFTEPPS